MECGTSCDLKPLKLNFEPTFTCWGCSRNFRVEKEGDFKYCRACREIELARKFRRSTKDHPVALSKEIDYDSSLIDKHTTRFRPLPHPLGRKRVHLRNDFTAQQQRRKNWKKENKQ